MEYQRCCITLPLWPLCTTFMNDADQIELYRVCDQLEHIDQQAQLSSEERAALKKAGLALHHVFRAGSRAELERAFDSLDQPLTKPQRAQLRSLGIDPGFPVA